MLTTATSLNQPPSKPPIDPRRILRSSGLSGLRWCALIWEPGDQRSDGIAYETEMMEKALQKYRARVENSFPPMNSFGKNGMGGLLEGKYSHQIVKLWKEGNEWWAELEVDANHSFATTLLSSGSLKDAGNSYCFALVMIGEFTEGHNMVYPTEVKAIDICKVSKSSWRIPE
jgi:hypothetical protein